LAAPNHAPPIRNEAPVVEFHDVRVRFGDATILRGFDLAIAAGELFVLLGRSGAGKSTVLRLANRLVEPWAGSVRVGGVPVEAIERTTLRRRTGYVIQETGLFPHFTVQRNIDIVPRLLGWDSLAREARVEEMLALTGLAEAGIGRRLPHELSGGQRQRVGVARALAADPDLLLCDEPFGSLDPITRRDMQREFTDLTRRIGKTMLFVTHDVEEALAVGTRIGVLSGGALTFEGTPDEFRTSTDPLIRSLRSERS